MSYYNFLVSFLKLKLKGEVFLLQNKKPIKCKYKCIWILVLCPPFRRFSLDLDISQYFGYWPHARASKMEKHSSAELNFGITSHIYYNIVHFLSRIGGFLM